jgi:hypothetical protein
MQAGGGQGGAESEPIVGVRSAGQKQFAADGHADGWDQENLAVAAQGAVVAVARGIKARHHRHEAVAIAGEAAGGHATRRRNEQRAHAAGIRPRGESAQFAPALFGQGRLCRAGQHQDFGGAGAGGGLQGAHGPGCSRR